MRVELHCDGSIVSGNPGGTGGWAYAIIAGGRSRVVSGPIAAPTTNNVAEMTAAINALQSLKRPTEVTIHSDSEYVVNAFVKGWIEKWAGRNWSRRSKKSKYGGPHKNEAMPNADLWMKLNSQDIFHDVTWVHVKGHQENPEFGSPGWWNNVVDEEARSEAKLAQAVHGAGLVGSSPIPGSETLEGRLALTALIKNLPSPPDPPASTPPEVWAVFQHHANGTMTQTYVPVSPSEYGDGGKKVCEQAALRMNQTAVRDPERKKKTVKGKPIYEARRVSGVRQIESEAS